MGHAETVFIRISAAVSMRRLFEEFSMTEKKLSNLKQNWKFLFIKNNVEERECEIVVE